MLHEPWWSEISPLRFASVEMTIGVYADIVISSGGACSGMEDYKTHRPLKGKRLITFCEPIRRMLIMSYDTDSQSRNVLASPLGEEGHEVAKGCTRVRMIMTLDMDVTAERWHYKTHRPLKGKRLTIFCASLALLPNVFAVHRFARGAADWRSGK